MIQRTGITTNLDANVEKEDTNAIWDSLIRPPRATFFPHMLEPKIRRFDPHTTFTRHDGSILVDGQVLFYNYFELEQEVERLDKPKSCFMYLHSHGSNRLEGMQLLRGAGRLRQDFAFFDFLGSGASGGTFTTMGELESTQTIYLMNELKSRFRVDRFLLWGRSMGAVAALRAAEQMQREVEFLVLDSPFPSFEQIVRDMGAKYLKIGEYVSLALFEYNKETLRKLTSVDFSLLRPIDTCSKVDVPCLFLSSKSDDLVLPERVNQMYLEYRSLEKDLITIEGSHTSCRTERDIENILDKLTYYYNTILKKRALNYPSRLMTVQRSDSPEFAKHNHRPQPSRLNQKSLFSQGAPQLRSHLAQSNQSLTTTSNSNGIHLQFSTPLSLKPTHQPHYSIQQSHRCPPPTTTIFRPAKQTTSPQKPLTPLPMSKAPGPNPNSLSYQLRHNLYPSQQNLHSPSRLASDKSRPPERKNSNCISIFDTSDLDPHNQRFTKRY